MIISHVRVKLVDPPGTGRLLAYCSVYVDDEFVIHEVKVISDGTDRRFVAMPSRKLCDGCPYCGHKNKRLAKFCNDCGSTLPKKWENPDFDMKVHADIAHPISRDCRARIQEACLVAYERELVASQQPGYVNTWEW